MDIREWVFVLGVIAVVIGALIWAAKWRRQRFDDIRPGDYSSPEEDIEFPTSELPSGGARTVGYRDPTDIERMNGEIRARAEASKPRLSSFRPEPVEQVSLLLNDDQDFDNDDLDGEGQETDIPLLLDPSDQHNRDNSDLHADQSNRVIPDDQPPEVEEPIESVSQSAAQNEVELTTSSNIKPDDNQVQVEELESLANTLRDDEPELELHVEVDDEPSRVKSDRIKAAHKKANQAEKEANERKERQTLNEQAQKEENQQQQSHKQEDKTIDPGEIIIINLMTQPDTPYEGELLYKVVFELGLRHGDMKIFHYCGRHGDQEPQFRMANLVKPGYFDLEDIASTRTHALCFFFELMDGQENMKIYESMLSVINKIRDDMGGELHDENRSVFTIQTSEHCRNRIRDFQRKYLLKR